MWNKLKAYWQNADDETRRKRIVSLVSIAIFAALSLVLFATVGKQLVLFASDAEGFRAWIDSHGFWGKIAYIGIVALQIVIAIIPGEPIELVAGYAFGAWQGLLLAEIGILTSSALVFLAVKKWGTKAVEAFISREKIESFRFLQDDRRRNALLFLIFLIPGSPKDALTYFVGLTPMTIWQWLFITGVARIPSVVSSTLTGAAVGDSQYITAAVIYGITGVVSVAGALLYKKFTAKKGKK